MTTPIWTAATAGQPTKAGQVNQFLTTHQSRILYTGTQTVAQTTAGTGAVATNGTYISQSFTTAAGQTAIGWASLQLADTGTPPLMSVSIQADVNGIPSGAPLVTTLLPQEFVTSTASGVAIPLPCTVTASTVYHVVVAAVGTATNFYSWSKSNQTLGAHTSTDGVTWTAQSYGLIYRINDQAPIGSLLFTYEDNGARWCEFAVTSGNVSVIAEFTQGQTAAGYLTSLRSLTYSSSNLISIV